MKVLPAVIRKLMPVLLLSFFGSAHAADTFDGVASTLTIPQVVVGNKTYSNVVLKLNNFQILAVDPNPLVGVVDRGFLFQFISAVKQNSQVKVTLIVTSQFQDRVAADIGGSGGAVARLTDNLGNIYNPSVVKVGNVESTRVQNFPFAADIPTTVTFTYNNIASNATSIGLLDLLIDLPGTGVFATYTVRNVPFQSSSTSPF